MARSTDAGETWQVTYADKFQEGSQGCTFQQYIGAQPFVDSRDGTLYVAAERIRHIRLATSTDGGATWSLSWATSGGSNELQPALSADGGVVHLAYYSIAPSNPIDVRLQDRSGSTVTTTRVTSTSFPGVPNLPQFDPIIADAYMGDYISIVSAAGHDHLAWGDNRDRVKDFLWEAGRNDPDVFFARR